ncbi:MAG: HepT-like ribonuclease domain-containing protein, partial [Hydrogenophaga sp.]
MSKPWQPYALHILDAIDRIRHIQARGDLNQDQILYDAALRNLQTLSEATQQLPDALNRDCPLGAPSVLLEFWWCRCGHFCPSSAPMAQA